MKPHNAEPATSTLTLSYKRGNAKGRLKWHEKTKKSRHDPAATSPMTTKPDGRLGNKLRKRRANFDVTLDVSGSFSYLIAAEMVADIVAKRRLIERPGESKKKPVLPALNAAG
jgi:hypothetical protein